MENITIQGVQMSKAAAENVVETGADVQADVAAMRTGAHTRASLLAYCLDGAEDDRADGWREYVSAVVLAAEDPAAGPERAADEAEDEPAEPHCTESEHAWEPEQSGCRENPGVWGSSRGGVLIVEVCAHCGARKTTDSGATDYRGRRCTRVSYAGGEV